MTSVYRYGCLVVLGCSLVLCQTREAWARKQYDEQFKAMYVKEGTPLADAVATAKCNVCHAGASKKDRNAYGQALAGVIEKNTKDVDAIKKALGEAAAMSSDPSKPGSPTFGGLIEQGKLPAGAAQ